MTASWSTLINLRTGYDDDSTRILQRGIEKPARRTEEVDFEKWDERGMGWSERPVDEDETQVYWWLSDERENWSWRYKPTGLIDTRISAIRGYNNWWIIDGGQPGFLTFFTPVATVPVSPLAPNRSMEVHSMHGFTPAELLFWSDVNDFVHLSESV